MQAECSISQYAERLANRFDHARTVRQLKHELKTQTTMMLMSQRTPKSGNARQESGGNLLGDNEQDPPDQDISVAASSLVRSGGGPDADVSPSLPQSVRSTQSRGARTASSWVVLWKFLFSFVK